ncbi:dolichyl-diphosphooligosaccharide--protein glycosyltransferase subunit 2 [Ensifer adhaerens]|uniref:dolichyl-diphosphooligosaccharide--protein glycosyltransferase subunit 2 n=1 Tax=Ensifer adhaerens TaxID=106592 RepID=UPI001CEFE379|nr:dolichyl-diphosphooligosaccharide--protein glycosyltransferase subunit 2 [Ensifer adhaerens]UCM24914.1 dolichyl-diphosphooligosaccharide--protein glycosyltransferase subunit 2 [Ensifer adhaerens]
MTEKTPRATLIASATILVVAGIAFYFMPSLVLWLAEFSPWLGFGVGICLILAFFGVFWLRAMYQRRADIDH